MLQKLHATFDYLLLKYILPFSTLFLLNSVGYKINRHTYVHTLSTLAMLLLGVTMSTTGEKSENEVVACDSVRLDRETRREMTAFIAILLTEGRYLEFQGFLVCENLLALLWRLIKICKFANIALKGKQTCLRNEYRWCEIAFDKTKSGVRKGVWAHLCKALLKCLFFFFLLSDVHFVFACV